MSIAAKAVQRMYAEGRTPPRKLWKHLPRSAQEKLVLESLRKELYWLGVNTNQLEDDELLYVLRNLL